MPWLPSLILSLGSSSNDYGDGKENVKKAIGFGHVHTNSNIPETAYFFIRVRVDGVLNCSGERFQNDAVSEIGFSGFVWMKSRFV